MTSTTVWLLSKRRFVRARSRPWISGSLARLRNKRRKAARRAAATGTEADKAHFDAINSEFHDTNSAAYADYVRRQGDKLCTNPKEFWNFVNTRRKCDGYPETMRWRDSTANDTVGICNLFSEFFGSVYSRHNGFQDEALDFQPQRKVDDTIDKTVTRTEVRRLLEGLDATKGAGPDGIAPVFWKRAASSIAVPLAMIFARSLANCTFPD